MVLIYTFGFRFDGGDCEIVKLINGAKRTSLGKKKKNKKKGKGENGSQDKNMLSSSQLAEASESQVCKYSSTILFFTIFSLSGFSRHQGEACE